MVAHKYHAQIDLERLKLGHAREVPASDQRELSATLIAPRRGDS